MTEVGEHIHSYFSENNFIKTRPYEFDKNLGNMLKTVQDRHIFKFENIKLYTFFGLKNSRNVLGSAEKKHFLKALVTVCIVCIH